MTSRQAGSLLKSAQEVLPLVLAFHKSHNSLTDWLVSAEQTLQTADSQPNSEQVMAALEREVAQNRPLLDQVNQAGPQLSQISPGDGAHTIEALVTRDNRRFEAIAEQVQRKAERLRQARQRHGEVVLDIDELLDWFRQVRHSRGRAGWQLGAVCQVQLRPGWVLGAWLWPGLLRNTIVILW